MNVKTRFQYGQCHVDNYRDLVSGLSFSVKSGQYNLHMCFHTIVTYLHKLSLMLVHGGLNWSNHQATAANCCLIVAVRFITPATTCSLQRRL